MQKSLIEEISADMAAELKDILGAGFVPDYYDSFAGGFADIARHYIAAEVKRALARQRRKLNRKNRGR